MFDYKAITSDDVLTTSFQQVSKNQWKAINRTSGEELGLVTKLEAEGPTSTFEYSDPTLEAQFNFWLGRPERKVGQLVNIEGRSLNDLMDMYEELLIGAYIMKNPAEKIYIGQSGKYAQMIDWLRTTDFYTAPASTQYHESFIGGLIIHSLKVYNEAMWLRKLPKFKNVPVESAAFVALVHDWCKISTYESYQKNVKNEKTGQWEKQDSFKRNFTGLTLGHGVTSMFLANKYFELTDEEAAAIRWHMGRWNTVEVEVNEMQKCNHQYPLVYLIQFADQLSITEY